ncbi:sigma-70 family RNA polymerase sigma factor [Parapedobacter sp. GCM10030251]|uniref:sigma-70 family RNA polymerase sigma factor n=1 Tax=Parapedobacter sp. GCM10030251 TaxID=3273419 RepID=UPI00361CE67B
MASPSDQELIIAIRNSDIRAFEQLHGRYWTQLYDLAYRRIGHAEDTGDLLQDLFIELWEIRDTLYFENPPANWLRNRLWFKIAHYFRDKGSRERHRQDFSAFMKQQHTLDCAMNDEHIREAEQYYAEICDALNQTIGEMPQRMREIFRLNKAERLTVKEIAVKLEISPQTVKTQLERAMLRVRKTAGNHHPTTFGLVLTWWLLNL